MTPPVLTARQRRMRALVIVNVVCSTGCMWCAMLTGAAWPLLIVITVNLPLGYWAAMRY